MRERDLREMSAELERVRKERNTLDTRMTDVYNRARDAEADKNNRTHQIQSLNVRLHGPVVSATRQCLGQTRLCSLGTGESTR